MDYAILDNNNIVDNLAVSTIPLNEKWIPLEGRRVAIGDIYDGADFYRGGEKVLAKEEELDIALKILTGDTDYFLMEDSNIYNTEIESEENIDEFN